MSSGDFNRVERPEARDRLGHFRATTQAMIEYRNAYAALAATDPAEALRHPHPDDEFDLTAALLAIRGVNPTLKGDPRVDIRG